MTALIVQLREFWHRLKQNHVSTRTEGGCDTCGYGGTEVTEVEDAEKLIAEIDLWIEERFNTSKGKR